MRFVQKASRGPRFAIAVACAGMLSAAGCGLLGSNGSKQTMLSSAQIPAGEGTVQAKTGANGNTEVEVRVKHLAPPSKVAADASVYVVWIKPHNAEIQNLGALEVDSDLAGKIDTTTPYRAFTLTITPEPSARMAAPTHQPVFTSEVGRTQ